MTENNAELAEMQALLMAKDVENSVLSKENDRLKRALSDRNETLASMPGEVERRSNELATMRKECSELKCSLDAKSQQYEQLLPEYNKVKEEYIRLVPQVVQLRTEKRALAKELEAEKDTNATLTKDNEALRKETDLFFGKYKGKPLKTAPVPRTAAETKVGQLQAELEKKQKEVDEQQNEVEKQRKEAEEQRRLVEILRDQFRAGDSNNNQPQGASCPPAQSADVVPVQKEPAGIGQASAETGPAEAMAAISSEFSALIMSGIMTEFSALVSSVQTPQRQAMNAPVQRPPCRIPTPTSRALGPTARPYNGLMGSDIQPYHPYLAALPAQMQQPLPVLMPAVKRPAIPATKKKVSQSSLLATYRAAVAARRNAQANVTTGDPATPHSNNVAHNSKRNEAGSKKVESPAMAAYHAAAAAQRKGVTEALGSTEMEPAMATEPGQQAL